MSEINRVQCDLCLFVWTPRSWESGNQGGELNFCRDGINGKKSWAHLCRECRTAFADAFDEISRKRFQTRIGHTDGSLGRAREKDSAEA